jgi:hypothetical protein
MIRYAILNPMTGSYEFADTLEIADDTARAIAVLMGSWERYLFHTHGIPISQVTTDAQGYETWQGLDTLYGI